MLGRIRRAFQNFAILGTQCSLRKDKRERETQLQKVLFWSLYTAVAPEPYPPPTLLEHPTDSPSLSWPFFPSVFMFASLTLLQLQWLLYHLRSMPDLSAEFLCSGISSAAVVFSKLICLSLSLISKSLLQ